MKLELKHIAPYLPYQLVMRYTKEGRPFRGTKKNEVLTIQNIELLMFSQFRFPILRPLSDLTKDKKFINLINDELICGAWKFDTTNECITIKTTENNSDLIVMFNEIASECPYFYYTWFLEHHYDIHNLIENDLAIDINTL